MRILIADDHAILRRGLMEILRREFKDAVLGEVENADLLVEQVQLHDWDVVILDVAMPGRSGIDILSELKRRRPKVAVLVLSMHSEEQYGRRALKAGASGYITKDSSPEELMRAIRKVLGGGRYVSGELAEKLALELRCDIKQSVHEALSDREMEVLRLLALGKTVSQIAELLHLSVTTISTYRSRLLEKMNMSTNAELMHYALWNHLVE
jgi:two-component system, NarL family, invasion response regulator UvrY